MASLWQLTWADVAPSAHPLSTEGLEAALCEHLAHVPQPSGPAWEWRYACVAELDRMLVERFGAWALGWRYSMDEGDPGGGVVTSWCCNGHSFFPGGYDPALIAGTAGAIVLGLNEWRAHLIDLEKLYDALARDPDATPAVAIGRVVEAVIVATSCGDAWYVHASQAVAWYLEHRGAPAAEALTIAAEALRGRFHSWIAPPKDTLDAAAAAVADAARAVLAP